MKTHKCKEHGELTGCLWCAWIATIAACIVTSTAYVVEASHPWALGALTWFTMLVLLNVTVVRLLQRAYRKSGKGCPKCLTKFEAHEVEAVPRG